MQDPAYGLGGIDRRTILAVVLWRRAVVKPLPLLPFHRNHNTVFLFGPLPNHNELSFSGAVVLRDLYEGSQVIIILQKLLYVR